MKILIEVISQHFFPNVLSDIVYSTFILPTSFPLIASEALTVELQL